MSTTRRQGPIQLYVNLGGLSDASAFTGGSSSSLPVGRGVVSHVRVDGVMTRTRTGTPGGESDGVFLFSFSGTFTIARDGDDAVSISDIPSGWATDDDGSFTGGEGNVYAELDSGNIVVWLSPDSDDGDLTGFLVVAKDESGALGGTRNTNGIITVERPLEVVG